MTLAKTSFGVAESYLELVRPKRSRSGSSVRSPRSTNEPSLAASRVEERALLDRHPVLQRSIRPRNPYVDPMNAIQVELLRRHRARDETARRPLLRSIAGIAAALRNTG